MTGQTGYGPAEPADGTGEALSLDALHAVVELQRAELSRLLREQTRLNDRIDSLLRLHEREQVLRQQMQASLDRLAAARVAVQDRQLGHDAVPADGAAVAGLRTRLERTEARFAALQDAVGSLVAKIERNRPGRGDAAGSAAFVRVYAPGG